VSGRFNSEFKIKDRVTIGENMNVTFRTDNGTGRNGEEGSAMAMGVIVRSQSYQLFGTMVHLMVLPTPMKMEIGAEQVLLQD
jgi:hypothetical protein